MYLNFIPYIQVYDICQGISDGLYLVSSILQNSQYMSQIWFCSFASENESWPSWLQSSRSELNDWKKKNKRRRCRCSASASYWPHDGAPTLHISFCRKQQTPHAQDYNCFSFRRYTILRARKLQVSFKVRVNGRNGKVAQLLHVNFFF